MSLKVIFPEVVLIPVKKFIKLAPLLSVIAISLFLASCSYSESSSNSNNQIYKEKDNSYNKFSKQKSLKKSSNKTKNSIIYKKLFFSVKKLIRKISFLHPYVIHFPVVLIFLAPIFWILNYLKPKPEFLFTAQLLLLLGFIAVVLAMITGHAEWAPGKKANLLERHAIFGELVIWCMAIALGIRIGLKRWNIRPWYHFGIIFFLILANIIMWATSITGYSLLDF